MGSIPGNTGMITLKDFGVSLERGFLPAQDPLESLPGAFSVWDEVSAALPKLLVSTKTRDTIDRMPLIDAAGLQTEAELERAMVVLSYLGHSYVWFGKSPAERIPPSLAVPWAAVAERLGRPPVLSYASYALHNWRRLVPQEPVALGNIGLLVNFWGGADEEWFVLVHIEIEMQCGEAMQGAAEAVNAAQSQDAAAALSALQKVERSLARAHATLERMPELCDPYIYYHRVRPYIHGWKNHPVLTKGLIYDGVKRFGGAPQQFRGETGAQSSIVPALDAALGVSHQDDPLRPYLIEMQDYMPPQHRAFVRRLEAGPSVRGLVLALKDTNQALRECYNACITWLEKFRGLHLQYAAQYIHAQAQKSAMNPNAVGTGGTPFIPYLTKHRDETGAHRI